MNQYTQLGTARLSPSQEEPAEMAQNPLPATVAGGPLPPLTPEQIEELTQKAISVVSTCYDPEVPVNIYELGLIYGLDVAASGSVAIRMTLTSPACPVAGSLVAEVQRKVQMLPGVSSVQVELVWDPPWDKSRMSEAARLELGLDDW